MSRCLSHCMLIAAFLLSGAAYAVPTKIKIYHNPSVGVQTEALVFEAVRNLLPQYSLFEEEASVDRALKNVQQKDGLCVRNLLKNKERSEYLLFSEPLTYFLGLNVYASPKLIDTQTHTFASLQELFAKQPNWVLGVEKERSYGDAIDNLIRTLPAKQLYRKDGSENEAQMHAMLVANRIDILFEYPSVIAYHNSFKALLRENQPIALAVTEISPLASGRIACIDTPETRAFLDDFNTQLKQLYNTSQFMEWHLNYISPSLHAQFQHAFSLLKSN
ncbi:hypothetical protein ACFOEE_04980 [Pseudoalteromonas fenneropenaei]|uniref:Solute-binding protein family 3/N-terminal domain-containing protein n=1 Tax=Pseudoalteromonas fenneropenaei TaxID=1737459 RepID=A0ABV7CH03_9GAMM